MLTYSFRNFTLNYSSPRRGGVEEGAGLWIKISGFDSQDTLKACGPSVGKDVQKRLRTTGARVKVGSASLRPLAARGVGCLAAGLNLENGQRSHHYIAEIKRNVPLNRSQLTNHRIVQSETWCIHVTYKRCKK